MSIVLQETDTAGNCAAAAACSGGTLATQTLNREATARGAPGAGSSEVVVGGTNFDPGQSRICCIFQTKVGEPGYVYWEAGTWTVRINVTSSNNKVVWDDTYICRLNSGCTSQATVASLTGQGTSLGSTGQKTHVVTGGAAQNAAVGDVVYIVLIFTSSGNNQTVGITPSETIDTPIVPKHTDWKPHYPDDLPEHHECDCIASGAMPGNREAA